MVGKSNKICLKAGQSSGVVIIQLAVLLQALKNKWKNTASGPKCFQDTAARNRAEERLSKDVLILTLYIHTLVHP